MPMAAQQTRARRPGTGRGRRGVAAPPGVGGDLHGRVDRGVKRTGGGPGAQRRSRGSTGPAREGAGRHAPAAPAPGNRKNKRLHSEQAAASPVCSAGVGRGARSILPEKGNRDGGGARSVRRPCRGGGSRRTAHGRKGGVVPAYSCGAPKRCVVTHSESRETAAPRAQPGGGRGAATCSQRRRSQPGGRRASGSGPSCLPRSGRRSRPRTWTRRSRC